MFFLSKSSKLLILDYVSSDITQYQVEYFLKYQRSIQNTRQKEIKHNHSKLGHRILLLFRAF